MKKRMKIYVLLTSYILLLIVFCMYMIFSFIYSERGGVFFMVLSLIQGTVGFVFLYKKYNRYHRNS